MPGFRHYRHAPWRYRGFQSLRNLLCQALLQLQPLVWAQPGQ